LARFENKPDVLVACRSTSCRSVSFACSATPISALPDCGWRKAYPKLDAFHQKDVGAAIGENLGCRRRRKQEIP